MKAVSLLAVFLVVKLCMVWGHAPPLTGWTLLAYAWQDVAIALGFGAIEIFQRRTSAIYWTLAIYAALNIPVERALSTPVTA